MSNGREAIESALEREHVDRIPAMYQYLAAGPGPFNAIGLEMQECYHDAEKFARATAAVREAYGYDNIMAGWGCILLEAHAMGTEIEFPRSNGYPQGTKPFLADPANIESLAPVDPMDNELLRVRMRASEILASRYGKEFAVMGNMVSPGVVAWELRGYEGYLMDMFFEKELAHRYLSVIVESLRIHGERLAEMGVDMIFFENDFTASQEYAPLESMREFDLDYAVPCVEALHGMGHKVIVHNCTALPLVEEQVNALRPDGIHYNADNVPDHVEMCKRLKGKVCLCPGVDEGLVYDGPPEIIADTVRRIASHVANHDAFIMASAYEVPFKTKDENHLALIDTIRSLR